MCPDRRVRRVLEVLQAECTRPISIADLSFSVGLGLSRLEALFKAEARMSIREFLHALRLEKAAELIATTDERISQIVYSVGFRDPSNFNHAFKKRFGVAPKQYREQQRTLLDASYCDSNQRNGIATNESSLGPSKFNGIPNIAALGSATDVQ